MPSIPPPDRAGVAQFLRETRQELRKVAWPRRPAVRRAAAVVLAVLAVLVVLLVVLDLVFGWSIAELFMT